MESRYPTLIHHSPAAKVHKEREKNLLITFTPPTNIQFPGNLNQFKYGKKRNYGLVRDDVFADGKTHA